MAGQAKKSRKHGNDRIKCKEYRLENKRLKNKSKRLARRWKNYKIQPPKALNGIKDGELKHMIEKKLLVFVHREISAKNKPVRT